MRKLTSCSCVLLFVAATVLGQGAGISFERILNADREPHNWLTYSRTVFGHRYSPLAQITTGNVENLTLAWLWQSRSLARFQATPLAVDGTLYTVQSPNDVVALDATTGRIRWTYPYAPAAVARASGGGGRVNRGLAILGDTLFMGTLDAHLVAISATTGKLLWNTTVADAADPACNVPTPGYVCYVITHAPLVVKDKVIVGTAGGDTQFAGFGIRGFVAAFDAKSGREVWRFSTIPAPGEPGSDTWSGESWKTGGVGVWNTGAYDPELNLTYWGTGNAAPPGHLGPALASSRPGDNLYSNSVVALDADTGRLRWHYQFTPHDDMDWDAAQVPVLTDLEWNGRERKVMLWANRNGVMYVLDRTTGEFLMGKPFVEADWLSGFDERGRPIRVPGKVGGPEGGRMRPASGTNWYPPSFSPRTGLFYIPAWERGTERGLLLRGDGYSAVRAFNPRTGGRAWEFKVNDAIFTSGVLTTGGDLVFAGVEGDFYSDPASANLVTGNFYALDARTGQRRWMMALGGPVQGAPISYAAGGRQYVAVSAGNSLFGFALRPAPPMRH
jgi:alcohol dehydrogenase (cytochrome c)